MDIASQSTVQSVVEVDEKEPSALAPHEVLGMDFWSGQAVRLKDGGGIISDADWKEPKSVDRLGALRRVFMQRISSWNLSARLLAHVATAKREPLLNEREVCVLQQDMAAFLTSEGFPCSAVVDKGQPLTLSIWDALLKFLGDVDTVLPSLLMQGVPTGILADIPMSGVWRPVEPDDRPNLELLLHAEPWGSALDDPDCLLELVEADVQAGFAEWIPGGLPEAKERYGDLCAAGRLGLVKKEGSQPRLIGDSSISNANQLSRICEKVELPSLEDVAQFVSRHQDTEWHAFSLDIAKAHKRIRVCHAERGLSLFAVVDSSGATRWLVYNTTHFGCAWAAYWWARTAAAFVRALHCFLQGNHFAAMYVDDLLALFPRQAAPLMACLCVTFACGLGLPLSWHKLQLSSSIKWIGWNFHLDGLPRAFLPPDKQEVLLAALAPLCRPGTWLRRTDLIDASHSRQPLVKGERLVRYEVNAVMDMGLEARALGQGVWEMRWLEVWWQEFPRPPM